MPIAPGGTSGGNSVTLSGSSNAVNATIVASDSIYKDDADWTASNSYHELVGGVYQSSPGTITDGDTGPIRLNANGAVHVDLQASPAAGITIIGKDAENSAVTVAPVLVGGRYDDLSDVRPALGDGDAGAIALASDGAVRVIIEFM